MLRISWVAVQLAASQEGLSSMSEWVSELFCYDCLCGLVVRFPGYRSRVPGFHSRRYQISWEVEGLERSPLSLLSTTEELLGRNSGGSGLENREYGRGDPLRWPRDILYPQKMALTSPTCGGRSVGIVRLRTKATEFVVLLCDSDLYRPNARVDRYLMYYELGLGFRPSYFWVIA
jgi:hypothetical protein